MPIYLLAPRDYYNNGTTGSDSYDGNRQPSAPGFMGRLRR